MKNKLELTEALKENLKTGSIKAIDMIAFLIDNGWKTTLPLEKTAINDLFTQKEMIQGLKLDHDFAYLELMERTKIEVTSDISCDRISVSSSSTTFISLENLKPINFADMKADIKAIRAKCRRNGVRFSCIKSAELDDLFSDYIKDYTEYTEKFYRTKSFWEQIVRNGLYSGYTKETDSCPSKGIGDLTTRSAPISRLQTIQYRINELKEEDLSMFNMVAI